MADKPKSAEMQAGVGFRMTHAMERPSPETVEAFRAFESPDVSDLLNRLYTMSTRVKLMTDPAHKLVGPACTVKVYPGDNLMVHKALDVAQPGDVIVVDSSTSMMTAVLGDLISTKARHRGVAGFVIDGLIRDLPAVRALADFPVFACGVTPIGPLHRGPGEINYDVSVGGIVIHPGDLVVGDLNGVVVVPKEVADDVARALADSAAAQADYVAAVARGEFTNTWVDALLASHGVSSDRPAVGV